jgi:hypothetical protein
MPRRIAESRSWPAIGVARSRNKCEYVAGRPIGRGWASTFGLKRVSGTAGLGDAGQGFRRGEAMTTTIDDLKRMARDTFGRELSNAEAEAYRGRLPTMVENVRRLRAWAPRLRQAEPALVQRVVAGDGDE